jgi:hypothetical protein
MAAKGHVKKIEIRKDRLIQPDFTQIYDQFTGVTKLIRGQDHFNSVKLKKGRAEDWDPYQESLLGKFGHVFQVKISIDFTLDEARDEGTDSRCLLEWWEYPTKEYGKLRANEWNQMTAIDASNSILDNWNKTVMDVKNAGQASVKILDRPNLRDSDQEKRRALYFCIVAKCTPGCECGLGYKAATAVQGLLVNSIGQKNFFFNPYPLGEFVSYDGSKPSQLKPLAFINSTFA